MKKLPKSQIEFEITVPWKEWEKYLDMAAEELSKEFKFPGFRPGKAPRHLVEQKAGKGALLNNAAERAVKKTYVDYILKEKIEAIGSPKIEIEELLEGKDLKYKATVSVMPEVEIKDGYASEIKKINSQYADKKAEPDDKEVDLEIEKLAASRVKLITVRREARKNDSAEIDFEVLMDNVSIENGTSKKHSVVIGRGVFIPGFEEQLIGMKEGEEKEFQLTFPETYHKKDLAGHPAKFKVKVNLVQERQTPEINDDFAKSLGKFENLAELKKNMREGLLHENEHKLADKKRADYLEKIVESVVCDLPDILIEQEVEKMLGEFEYQLGPMGMKLDQYLEKLKKNRDDLKKDWEPQGRKRILGALALTQIAKIKNLTASAKEIEEESNKTLQYYKDVKDIEKNINLERLYDYSKGVIENEKVFKYLEEL